MGLVVMALVVGAGAGLGAAGFRELIYFFTWLVTDHTQFGQQGHAPSLHLAWLGIWFVLMAPVIGGLVYGPADPALRPGGARSRGARGHGRRRRERRADPPAGHRRQGAGVGDHDRDRWLGRA
jgi:CIC family chloride channel protein